MPLALTDYQLKQVMQAASLIAPPRRDDFLRHLAAQLGDVHKVSDTQLTLVLCETLAQRGVAVGRQFFPGGLYSRHDRHRNHSQRHRQRARALPAGP
jgi:hypothetical protein